MSCTDGPRLMIEAYLVVAASTLYRLPEVRMRSYMLVWPDEFGSLVGKHLTRRCDPTRPAVLECHHLPGNGSALAALTGTA
jgi:hypothetical protein